MNWQQPQQKGLESALAPFRIPYSYGDVSMNMEPIRFDDRMHERSKQLREQDKQDRDAARHRYAEFIRLGCQLNQLQKLIYVQDNTLIKKRTTSKKRAMDSDDEGSRSCSLEKSVDDGEAKFDPEEMDFHLCLKGNEDFDAEFQEDIRKREYLIRRIKQMKIEEEALPGQQQAESSNSSSSSHGDSDLYEEYKGQSREMLKAELRRLKAKSPLEKRPWRKGSLMVSTKHSESQYSTTWDPTSPIQPRTRGISYYQGLNPQANNMATPISQMRLAPLPKERAIPMKKQTLKEKIQIEEAIGRYRERLKLQELLDAKAMTHQDIFKKEIRQGKFPNLKFNQNQLQMVYHNQQLRQQDHRKRKNQKDLAKALTQKHLPEDDQQRKAKLQVVASTPSIGKPIEQKENISDRHQLAVPKRMNSKESSAEPEKSERLSRAPLSIRTPLKSPGLKLSKQPTSEWQSKSPLNLRIEVGGDMEPARQWQGSPGKSTDNIEFEDEILEETNERTESTEGGNVGTWEYFIEFLNSNIDPPSEMKSSARKEEGKLNFKGLKRIGYSSNREPKPNSNVQGQNPLPNLNPKQLVSTQRRPVKNRLMMEEPKLDRSSSRVSTLQKQQSSLLPVIQDSSRNRGLATDLKTLQPGSKSALQLKFEDLRDTANQIDQEERKHKTIFHKLQVEQRQILNKQIQNRSLSRAKREQLSQNIRTYNNQSQLASMKKNYFQSQMEELKKQIKAKAFLPPPEEPPAPRKRVKAEERMMLKQQEEQDRFLQQFKARNRSKSQNDFDEEEPAATKGLILRNKYFIIELSNPQMLSNMKQDLEQIKELVGHNKYNPKEVDQFKVAFRSKKFQKFLNTYAQARPASADSEEGSEQTMQQNEGGEAIPKPLEDIVAKPKVTFVNYSKLDKASDSFGEECSSSVYSEQVETESEEPSEKPSDSASTNFFESQTSSFAHQSTLRSPLLLKKVESTPKKAKVIEIDHSFGRTETLKSQVSLGHQLRKRQRAVQQEQSNMISKKKTDKAAIKKQSIEYAKNLAKFQKSHSTAQMHLYHSGKKLKDPLVQYFVDADKKRVYPRTMGFMAKGMDEDSASFNIDSLYLSADYVDAFSQGIAVNDQLQELSFRNSNMTDISGIKIIKAIQRHRILSLDLSMNHHLSEVFYAELGDALNDPRFRLQTLVLEGNKMKDENCKLLCKSLVACSSIKAVNFNQNGITDASCHDICQLIYHCSQLQSLFLHYNEIMGKGSSMIASYLEMNESLKIFDISFNSICGGLTCHDPEKQDQQKYLFASRWAACFAQNKTLLHVDISNNTIAWREMEVIAQGLKKNHTILGIHVKGNQAEVNAQGFITPISAVPQLLASLHVARTKPKKSRSELLKRSNSKQAINMGENCWLCEGWSEIQFRYVPGQSDDTIDLKKGEKHDVHIPINIHLDCDLYEGDLLLPSEKRPGFFETRRMVPPGNRRYFFTIAGRQFCAEDQDKQALKTYSYEEVRAASPTKVSSKKIRNLEVSHQDQFQDFQVTFMPAVNVLKSVPICLDPYENIPTLTVLPREVKSLGGREKVKTPWIFDKSVFKFYRPDTKALLGKCFDNDWKLIIGKVEYLIKDQGERERVQIILRENYQYLRDAYKYTAGLDFIGNLLSIGNNSFTALMQSCGDFVDNKTMKISYLDLCRVAAKANDGKARHKMIPADRIVRHNLLEIAIRLADQKFIKSKACSTMDEAVELMVSNYLKPYFSQYNSHLWRKGSLWNEECDLAIKCHYKTFQKIFEKYTLKAGRNAKMLTITEFAEIISESGVISDRFSLSEVYPLWNLSVQTQVDEVGEDRHLYMGFNEFIEAICRVADHLSIPNLLTDKRLTKQESRALSSNTNEFGESASQFMASGSVQTELEKYGKRPLHEKIESFLLVLAKKCLSKQFYDLVAVPGLKQFKKDGLQANNITVSGRYDKY